MLASQANLFFLLILILDSRDSVSRPVGCLHTADSGSQLQHNATFPKTCQPPRTIAVQLVCPVSNTSVINLSRVYTLFPICNLDYCFPKALFGSTLAKPCRVGPVSPVSLRPHEGRPACFHFTGQQKDWSRRLRSPGDMSGEYSILSNLILNILKDGYL